MEETVFPSGNKPLPRPAPPIASAAPMPVILPAPPQAPPWRPFEFIAMLLVLTFFHLGFMLYLVPALEQVAASSAAPLPPLVRVYFAAARVVAHSSLTWWPMICFAGLGWLLGIHLMLRRHPLAQRLYCISVYLALLLLLVSVYTLSFSLGLSVVDFG